MYARIAKPASLGDGYLFLIASNIQLLEFTASRAIRLCIIPLANCYFYFDLKTIRCLHQAQLSAAWSCFGLEQLLLAFPLVRQSSRHHQVVAKSSSGRVEIDDY